MSQDIWTRCAPKFRFTTYHESPWRVVEAQHVIATRKLVDSDEEQAILEDLIEKAKPPAPYDQDCESYHYLLWTPFRYPPLKHGSRFGTPDRRGLWYGSRSIETAFAEKAYYTLLLRAGSSADFGIFEVTITAFSVPVRTRACADLTKPPFDRFEDELSSPRSYLASQQVGSGLMDRKTEVICFRSARCPNRGVNVAITTLTAFQKKKPTDFSTWFCTSDPEVVEFKPSGFQSVSVTRAIFQASEFEVGGVFPAPSLG